MFSSKELISFVFANENDIYYGDDLLKRDLNQYLWERLHGNYEAVYFLSADEDSFRVRSYGDLRCSEYTPKKKKLFGLLGGNSEQSELGGWIQRQLCAKPDSTAAFVCSLDDFCSVLSYPQWDPVLESIAEEKKRTGIFVLTASATAEKSAELLLTSPVFEKLHETTVTDLRDGSLRDLYSTLKKRKGDSCVFLNSFTWEHVHGVLLHLAMEYPDRCESCEELDMLSEYLYAYLRDPDFARDEQLLSEEPVAGYPMYDELYAWLRNERNWKRFEKRAVLFEHNGRKHMHTDLSPTDVAVLRAPNSYAGRCMKIKLPEWFGSEPDAQEQAQGVLHSIYAEVSVPKNKVENPKIIAFAEKSINQLDTVAYGDTETYNFVLDALKFCVGQIYASDEDEKTERILALLQKKQDAIGIFSQYFIMQRNLSFTQTCPTEGKLQSVTLQQLKSEFYTLGQIKKRYVDLISAMELELKMPAKSEHISDILEELTVELESFEQKLENVPDDIMLTEYAEDELPLSEPEPIREEEQEEMDFILTPDVYGFIPPSR